MKLLALLLSTSILLSFNCLAQESTIKRESFSLKYPSDWKIDTEDEDYDPDVLFSLDSPDGNNIIMFMLFNTPIEGDKLVDAQVKEFSSSLMKKPEVTSFSQWGKYKGTGKLMRGKITGVLKGFVRIFVYTDDSKSMLVVEQGYDDDLPTVQKGYDLISSSFTFH